MRNFEKALVYTVIACFLVGGMLWSEQDLENRTMPLVSAIICILLVYVRGRRDEEERLQRLEPSPSQLELKASEVRLASARVTQMELLERWAKDAKATTVAIAHRENLDRLASEIERADPPWSWEQRAKAWQSIAREPVTIESIRRLVAATTIAKPTLVHD